ncbi:MAG TPA: hypothetical protein VGQ76_05325 [Thermoanaerobaculia bacterium]|jgi:SAM-dependent methyltransferase|nr:hypothetical protein [Thermoanaerobaculia bacterium]
MDDVARSPFHGVRTIVRFNWPTYAVAAFVVVIAAAVMPLLDGLAVLVAGAAIVVALYFIVASLLASYLVYDHSEIYRWTWLHRFIGDARIILNMHAGFDETTKGVRHAMQGNVYPFVFYDAELTTEPSLERARDTSFDALPFHAGHLPCRAASCDAILFLFAAHEMRDPEERVRCFADVASTLKEGGRVIVLEHLRDAWTFAVYGPGAMHFYSRAEWLRVARGAGLAVAHEGSFTPFAHYFVLERNMTVRNDARRESSC